MFRFLLPASAGAPQLRGFFALASFLVMVSMSQAVFGQCGAGESFIEVEVVTDAWGYEAYWEIVPTGNGCGNGPLLGGGNSANVGCDGDGGGAGWTGTAYPNNSVVEVPGLCLADGESFDLIYVDSYGDGGITFRVYMDGALAVVYGGTGDGNTWTFTAGEPLIPVNDSPCFALPIAADGVPVEVSNAFSTANIPAGEPTPGAAPNGACGLQGFWCGSDGAVTRTVWLTFTATATSPLLISSCESGTTFDTQLALYKAADCSNWSGFQLVAAQDDTPGGCSGANGYASRMYTSCLEVGATYFIQVDGWNGATGTAFVTMQPAAAWETDLLGSVSNLNCPLGKEGEPDGAILVTLQQGGIDFEASWTGPAGFSAEGPSVTGLAPGAYGVVVTTSCGNTFAENFNVTAPTLFQPGATVTPVACDGATNGAIALQPTGGSAPYNFSWSGPGGFTSELEDLSGLEMGPYALEVEDDNGCVYTAAYLVNSPGPAFFSLGNDTIICEDQGLFLAGPGGWPSYTWQDGSVNQFFQIPAGGLAPGTYSFILTATNAAGCSFADAILVTVHNCSTGLAEPQGESEVRIFPQPADAGCWVQAAAGEQVVIWDAQGRQVAAGLGQGQNPFWLDTSRWAPGVYVCRSGNLRQTFWVLH
jgi:hypothetical protein